MYRFARAQFLQPVLISFRTVRLLRLLDEADVSEPAAYKVPQEVDQGGHEGREEGRYRRYVFTEGTQGACFYHTNVLRSTRKDIVVALDVSN